MALTKVLIVVKTYPTLSEKYDELVCTAGFLENGSWIRIYPIPFRKLGKDSQYKKWQWITIDIVKNNNDFRSESYRPTDIDKEIFTHNIVNTKKNWASRKPFVYNEVYTNLDKLINDSKKPPYKSLAVLKPTKILNFVYEEIEREWDQKKINTIYSNQCQIDLFEQDKKVSLNIVKKLPYKFSYIFTTEDGKERKMMIEDWELGMLYWNCLKRTQGDEKAACELVRQKYYEEMVTGKDFHFFVGTTKSHHLKSKNPYIIIGTFWPKYEIKQPTLFDMI